MISGMAKGVPILGVNTKKCKVVQEATQVFRITLIQGLNRQIRRMCEHFGYEVTKLERVRIMNIGLKGLPVGEWRDLTESEMEIIYNLLEDSSNEDVRKSSKTATPKKPKTASTSSSSHPPKSKTPYLSSPNFGNPPKKKEQRGGTTKKSNSRRPKGR
jgi:23S rRNA pseudouridine2604 synthase